MIMKMILIMITSQDTHNTYYFRDGFLSDPTKRQYLEQSTKVLEFYKDKSQNCINPVIANMYTNNYF